MEKKETKIFVLVNNQVLISHYKEIGADIGEADCKLINPVLIKNNSIECLDKVLEPFLYGYTKQNIFKINSDKILTIADPTPTLLEKYEDLIKE